MGNFNQIQSILNKATSVEKLRFKVLSNNIANVDTPNFKKSRVVFESLLKRSLKGDNSSKLQLEISHKDHISGVKSRKISDIHPKVVLQYETSYRNDKNNVDIDQESNLVLRSSLRYMAFSEIMNRKFKSMRYVLTA